MKRTTITAVAAIALLTLTGCAESASNATDEHGAAETSTAAAPSETPEPLEAKTTPPESTLAEADAAFASYVRGELLPDTTIGEASDEQLVAAGHDACEQLLDGVDSLDIRLVEGEQPATSGYYMDSAAIIDGARRFYCPETIH